jgi:hypothetical protein
MDGSIGEVHAKELRRECLLMSSDKVQKLVRKTRRSKGRNAEFYVINETPIAEPPVEFHIGEEITAEQLQNTSGS